MLDPPNIERVSGPILIENEESTRFEFDELQCENLSGWILMDEIRPNCHVTLQFDDTVIARARINSDHPASILREGKSYVANSFSVPFMAADIYSRLLASEETTSLKIAFGKKSLNVEHIAARYRDSGAFKSLCLHDCVQVRLSDIWFCGGTKLRLRLYIVESGEIDAFNHATMKFYQLDEAGHNLTKMIYRHPIEKRGLSFITIDLLNPYMPLLISLSNSVDEFIVLDVLPFPSLCRGGRHYAELQSLAWTGRYVDDLRLVSDSLLRELCGSHDQSRKGTIREVRVNRGNGTGAEPIYSPDMRLWLERVFGAKLIFDVASISTGRLDKALGPDAVTGDSGRCTLHIPADAIPTISALASKRLPLPVDGTKSGPFVAADARENIPTWFVSVPPFPNWLDQIQPLSARRFFPIVTGYGHALSEYTSEPIASDVPLAVRFMATIDLSEEARVLPTARDAEHGIFAPKLTHDATNNGPLVSVIVSVRNGVTDCINFCSSLASQTFAERVELVIVDNRSSRPSRDAIGRAAEALFKDRVRIFDFDAPFNHSAQSNFGAEQSRGSYLLFANSDVVLTDRRTVETLTILADNEQVASASCTPVHERGASPTLRFRSAGVFRWNCRSWDGRICLLRRSTVKQSCPMPPIQSSQILSR